MFVAICSVFVCLEDEENASHAEYGARMDVSFRNVSFKTKYPSKKCNDGGCYRTLTDI